MSKYCSQSATVRLTALQLLRCLLPDKFCIWLLTPTQKVSSVPGSRALFSPKIRKSENCKNEKEIEQGRRGRGGGQGQGGPWPSLSSRPVGKLDI